MKEPIPRSAIVRPHGRTTIGILRKIYGRGFARGEADDVTLAEAMGRLDAYSLAQLLHHLKRGELQELIGAAEGGDLG